MLLKILLFSLAIYIAVTIAVKDDVDELPDIIVKDKPFSFRFTTGDYLNVNLTFNNIPKDVTHYSLRRGIIHADSPNQYEIENIDKDVIENLSKKVIHVTYDTNHSDENYNVIEMTIYIVLYKITKKFTINEDYRTIIMAAANNGTYNNICLNIKRPCVISVDLYDSSAHTDELPDINVTVKPFSFQFYTGDYLNMILTFKNIPKDVTYYALYRGITNASLPNLYKPELIEVDEIENLSKKVIRVTYDTDQIVQNYSVVEITVYIVLYTINLTYYTKTIIMAAAYNGSHSNICLNIKRPCIISVDLYDSSSHADKPKTIVPHFKYSNVGFEQFFTCDIPDKSNFWNLNLYNDYKLIRAIHVKSQSKVKNITLFLTTEYFDDNLEVCCMKEKYISTKYAIRITPHQKYNRTINYQYNKTLRYFENKEVQFSCKEYETIYIQVALINTTSNVIKFHHTELLTKVFTERDNGTILFCVYYVIKEFNYEVNVTRYVKNKTLLLYDSEKERSEKGKSEKGNNEESNSEKENTARDTIIYIVSAAAILTFLFIVYLSRRYCRRKYQEVESETYANDGPLCEEPQRGQQSTPREMILCRKYLEVESKTNANDEPQYEEPCMHPQRGEQPTQREMIRRRKDQELQLETCATTEGAVYDEPYMHCRRGKHQTPRQMIRDRKDQQLQLETCANTGALLYDEPYMHRQRRNRPTRREIIRLTPKLLEKQRRVSL